MIQLKSKRIINKLFLFFCKLTYIIIRTRILISKIKTINIIKNFCNNHKFEEVGKLLLKAIKIKMIKIR